MTPFNRLLLIMTRPIMIMSVFLLITCSFFFMDLPLATYFNAFDLVHKFPLLNLFTNLGTVSAYVIIFFIGAIYFRYKRIHLLWETRMWFLWLCVFSTGIFCLILKILLGRARPALWFENKLYGFYGLHGYSDFWSFPSGHTTCIMAVAFGFGIIFPRYLYSLIGLGLLVAISRVLLVHHYLSDVLIAAYLTLLEIGFLLWYLKTSRFKNHIENLSNNQ